MKKTLIIAAIAALTLTSCTSTQNTTQGSNILGSIASGLIGSKTEANTSSKAGATTGALAQAGTNMLGNLLGNLLGTNKVTEKTLVGTWQYQGIDCVFESENFLSKAGGELAAATIEGKIDQQLQRLGIKPGTCSFTFNADHTWRGSLGGKNLSGQWVLDEQNKQIQMTYLMGLASLTPKVAYNNGTLSLLFESSKLLTLAQGVGALTNNSTATALSGLIKNYNGMYIGLQLKK